MKNKKPLRHNSVWALIKVISAIILALLILASSFQLSIWMTEKKMEHYVDKETERKSSYVNLMTDLFFQTNEWCANNFLAGFTDFYPGNDSTTERLKYKAVLSDENRSVLTIDDIYDQLESFCTYNYEYHAAILILEPNVLPEIPNGIAAKVTSADSLRHNLLQEGFNAFNDVFYQEVKSLQRMVVKHGNILNDSLYIYTIAIPIFAEDDRVIGEFWFDIDTEYLSSIFVMYDSKDNYAVCFIDSACKVIASSNSEDNGQSLHSFGAHAFKTENFEEWSADVKTNIQKKGSVHFKNKIDGESFVTYLLPLTNSPYKMLIVKSIRTIYDEVTSLMWYEYVLMFITLCLVTLCLIYILHVFKKKNDETSRIKGELNVAASIQRGILPANPVSSGLPFDIYGFQRSAKTVGGDLYDFVQKGDLLHFCIGDVSGKGMPASLVMTELCSLYRYIIGYRTDPRDIVAKINKAVMERSDESMFCTLFVGVLHLKTGLLEFCNAGHNPPIFISKNASQEKASFVKIKPNMPIYAFADYAYQSEALRLKPGDRFFFYTDGVTEAKDDADKFFGNEALLQTINRFSTASFHEMVQGVMNEVKTFLKHAVQNDDITMLCIEYKGTDEGISLHYDKVKDHVADIITDILDACHATEDTRLRLAVEEPIQNIADYAYADDGPLDVEINDSKTHVTVTMADSGTPFNPLESKTPDFSVPIQQRDTGGLGIFFTRQIMEKVTYRYENQQNILTLKYKKI